ncbi:IS110 family RNA-guided transposase, partial [Capillibacterium thermochitinicola]|uniref:IS110 family transposase n=1 Tax=Capillibacterium thermochitinicola TaxID=2699427 RepID=UPI001E2B8BB8
KTLIVGVDVASMTHFARAFDFRGIELGKIIRISNDVQGFRLFKLWVNELKGKYNRDTVMVGMEPTGHYWFNFAQFLKDSGIRIVLVNPFHVKRSKELDDNNPTKNDRKDPKTIAMLVKDGRYQVPYVPEGLYSELRTAMETRWHIVQGLNAIGNRVKRWLSIYFPEFSKVFSAWEGKGALIVLKEFPTPEKVLQKGVDGIAARWRKDKLRPLGLKRAMRLVEAAKNSVGVREGLRAAETSLRMLLAEYEMKKQQLEEIMVLVEELIYQIPGIKEVLKIKGIGLVTAAGFMAEVGDLSRFDHPKQIQKLAGLNIRENSSGKHKGKTTISKRGRRRLRALLFQGIMPVVAKNPEFRRLHQYYTTRAQNPLKKKQSLILLCCKLIRIIFALMKKQVAYDPQKMMNDIQRPVAA